MQVTWKFHGQFSAQKSPKNGLFETMLLVLPNHAK